MEVNRQKMVNEENLGKLLHLLSVGRSSRRRQQGHMMRAWKPTLCRNMLQLMRLWNVCFIN